MSESRTPKNQSRAGYSYVPFEANNTAALKHGAHSERMITPLAAKIANDLRYKNEYLRNPKFEESVLEYARVAAQVDLLQAYVDKVGMYDRRGRIRNAEDFLLKKRKHLSNLASRLALNPLASAQFERDTAIGALELNSVDAWLDAMLNGPEGEAVSDPKDV